MESILKYKSKKIDIEFEPNKLLKKAITGDKDAFAKIITQQSNYLYKIAFMHLKDEQRSLDAIQECAYKGFKNVKNLKDEKYFKSWLTRILINICIDDIRKTSKVVYLNEDVVLTDDTDVSLEESIDLYDAIDNLKPEYRTVIILKYFNDLSLLEISNITDAPINTVKTRLSRARNLLNLALKEDF